MVKLSGLWKADGMKKPELTDVGWLGPGDVCPPPKGMRLEI